ncbi:DUF4123 domain-containing protein [Cronobacter turicensis]|nr:DUF4123 domain-containing protein [Cronobacter turicensis]
MTDQHYAFRELLKIRESSELARLYALVDGIQYERATCAELHEEGGVCSLFSLPEDKVLAFAGPWLMDMSALTEDVFVKICQLEKEYPAVSWIISDQPLLSLSQHLQSCLMISFPSKQTGIFRFYDCRVLKALPELLSQEQSTHLMKYTMRWLFLSDNKINIYQSDKDALNVSISANNIGSKEVL